MKQFNQKLNVRFDKKPYVVEEEIHISENKYEGFLKHDNVDVKTINVYSGSKLSGDKINSFALSVDEELPWRTYIVINSNLSTVYISYETIGDTVEAEDVNELQEAITETDADLQAYKTDNTAKVRQLRTDVSNLDNRKAEKTYVDTELNKRYLKTETYNKEETESKLNLKADKTTMQSELNNRYKKNEVYTKNETDTRIQNIIGSAPSALDTLKEIADSLNNDANFAGTMTKELAKKADKTTVNSELANRYIKSEVYTKQETENKLNLKVDKVSGKQLSTNDYTTAEKQKLAGIEQSANRYVHPSSHQASMIVESSDKRFVSDLEKEKWDTVQNKINSENGELGDTITTFTVANTRENIQSKEKTKTVLGKIAKYFSDLKILAFTANWNDIVNKPSTYNPSAHNHRKSDIADFAHTHTLNEITNFPNQDLQDLKTNKHNHSNKSILDKITQTILDNISSAYNHISDTTKHITSAERLKWNKVDNKIDTSVANSKFATKEEVGNAGYGDMLKSRYDTNNDGKVDIAKLAESVTWSNVSGKPSTFTPSTHNHDDRYYTETEINNAFANKNKTNIFTQGQIIRLNNLKIGMSATGGNAQGVSWHKDGVESVEIAGMGALTSSGVIQKIYIGFGKNAWAENCVFEIFPNGVVNIKKTLRQGNKDIALKEDITRMGQALDQETSAPVILTKLKNVDGAGSGLDADLLDGKDSSAFALSNHNHNSAYYTKAEIDGRIKKAITWGDLKRGL